MITRVAMLILLQSDLKKAIDFYKKLGLSLQFTLPDVWAEFMLPDGVKLCLVPTTETISERKTGIVLAIDNLIYWYESMKNTINFVTPPIEKVHGIMATIKDPNGNLLDLYQATPEKVKQLIHDAVDQDHARSKEKGKRSEAKTDVH